MEGERARVRRHLPCHGEKLRTWSADQPVPWYRAISSFLFGARLDHGELLAGLVWHPAAARRFDHRLGCRAGFRGAARRRVGDLRERNRDRARRSASSSPTSSSSPRSRRSCSDFSGSRSSVRRCARCRSCRCSAGSRSSRSANGSIFSPPVCSSRSWRCRRSSRWRKMRCATCPAGSRKLPTRSARIDSRRSRASSFPLHSPASSPPILLGLGRVIGETMVVLLCAGNRIEIPDFTQGLGAIFQPVHTMTGIIAQEMGEVVRGSMHYRALFMVGLVLVHDHARDQLLRAESSSRVTG